MLSNRQAPMRSWRVACAARMGSGACAWHGAAFDKVNNNIVHWVKGETRINRVFIFAPARLPTLHGRGADLGIPRAFFRMRQRLLRAVHPQAAGRRAIHRAVWPTRVARTQMAPDLPPEWPHEPALCRPSDRLLGSESSLRGPSPWRRPVPALPTSRCLSSLPSLRLAQLAPPRCAPAAA